MTMNELAEKLEKATQTVDISKEDLVILHKEKGRWLFDIMWQAGNDGMPVENCDLKNILDYYHDIKNAKVKEVLDEYQEAILND